MIQQASFEDFFGILFTIIIVFLVLGWLFRLFLPYILRYLAMRFQKRIMKQFRQEAKQHEQEPRYNAKRPMEFKEKKKVGEYIDFEELDK